ncbi:hypothetical protein [Haloparvum sp. AD34]
MRKNSDAADYLNSTNPRVGSDLSLYVEAELERQELREKVDELSEDLEQMKSYLATKEVEDGDEEVFKWEFWLTIFRCGAVIGFFNQISY